MQRFQDDRPACRKERAFRSHPQSLSCCDEPSAVSPAFTTETPGTTASSQAGQGLMAAATICAHISYRPRGHSLVVTTNASAKLCSRDPSYRCQGSLPADFCVAAPCSSVMGNAKLVGPWRGSQLSSEERTETAKEFRNCRTCKLQSVGLGGFNKRDPNRFGFRRTTLLFLAFFHFETLASLHAL